MDFDIRYSRRNAFVARFQILGAHAKDQCAGFRPKQRQDHAAEISARCKPPGSQIHCGRSNSAGDEGVDRLVINLGRGADLHQHALVQHTDPVAHRHRLDLIMGDEQERLAYRHLQRLFIWPSSSANSGTAEKFLTMNMVC